MCFHQEATINQWMDFWKQTFRNYLACGRIYCQSLEPFTFSRPTPILTCPFEGVLKRGKRHSLYAAEEGGAEEGNSLPSPVHPWGRSTEDTETLKMTPSTPCAWSLLMPRRVCVGPVWRPLTKICHLNWQPQFQARMADPLCVPNCVLSRTTPRYTLLNQLKRETETLMGRRGNDSMTKTAFEDLESKKMQCLLT